MTTLSPDEAKRAAQAAALGGSELLNRVRTRLKKYVALPSEHAEIAVVLWIVATHAISGWEHATRLAIHSPVKRCGKSRLLEIIEALVHMPVATTNISVPALFRLIEKGGKHPPTLVLDEADRLFGSSKKDEDNRDLIALLNNGFRPGHPTIRCAGPLQVPTEYANFAMVAVAGIGRLPDTIEDRAVNITMRRRLPTEKVSKFRLRSDLPEMHKLRDQIAGWASHNLDALSKPVDDMPDDLEDRAQDAWEPLLAVARAAGETWVTKAREAAVKLAADASASDGEQSLDLRLLSDIRAVFAKMSNVSFLGTNTLLAELRGVEDAPWGGFDFTGRKLAMRLAGFKVGPRHNSAKTERGYHLGDFRDVFPRYLPSEASDPSETDDNEDPPPEDPPYPSGPSDPSETGADLGKRPDGSESPDGSTRPAVSTRPEETPGQTANGRVLTVLTDMAEDDRHPGPCLGGCGEYVNDRVLKVTLRVFGIRVCGRKCAQKAGVEP